MYTYIYTPQECRGMYASPPTPQGLVAPVHAWWDAGTSAQQLRSTHPSVGGGSIPQHEEYVGVCTYTTPHTTIRTVCMRHAYC